MARPRLCSTSIAAAVVGSLIIATIPLIRVATCQKKLPNYSITVSKLATSQLLQDLELFTGKMIALRENFLAEGMRQFVMRNKFTAKFYSLWRTEKDIMSIRNELLKRENIWDNLQRNDDWLYLYVHQRKLRSELTFMRKAFLELGRNLGREMSKMEELQRKILDKQEEDTKMEEKLRSVEDQVKSAKKELEALAQVNKDMLQA